MLTDEEIKAGAASFARTLKVVGGRTSFDYAVRAHLPWFAALVERGLGWNGIIRVLTAAGVMRDDGRVLSRGHISAVYWRQMHAAQPVEFIGVPAANVGLEHSRSQRSQGLAPAISTLTVPAERHAPAPPATLTDPVIHAASDKLKTAQALKSGDIRDYMRRALASQRLVDDDV